MNPKMFDNSVKSLQELFGDLEGTELQEAFDNMYLTDGDATVMLVDPQSGQFLIKRHPRNDRGERSSIDFHKKNISARGLVQGISMGAWLVPTGVRSVSGSMPYYASHFATRTEALEELLEEDPTKSNKMVQDSAKQLKHCKIYHMRMIGKGADYLKELGNSVNDQACGSTYLEEFLILISYRFG